MGLRRVTSLRHGVLHGTTAVHGGAAGVPAITHLIEEQWRLEAAQVLFRLVTYLVRVFSLTVGRNDAAVVGHQETVVVEDVVGAFQRVGLIIKQESVNVASDRKDGRINVQSCIRRLQGNRFVSKIFLPDSARAAYPSDR